MEDGHAEVGVLEVHGDEVFSLGVGHEGVGEVEVGLCGAEDVEGAGEGVLGCVEGDDGDLGGGVRDSFFHEKTQSVVWVRENEADDGAVAGILDAESDDIDVFFVEESDEGVEGTGTVFKHHRELDGEGAGGFDLGVCHDGRDYGMDWGDSKS